MKVFFNDIPNDRNIYGDNIAAKKNDYVIILFMMLSFVSYVIQQRCIQNPVSNITIKLLCSNS